MSEKQASSEYLKRTCLICGCHTNQTINIYEPRSGPNIVKLIQAKFKFQPLNEDKYLCFSCNNWLINWHSLQALNSNDAESPSGTFRSNVNPVVHDKASRKVAVVRPQVKEPPAPTGGEHVTVASPCKPAVQPSSVLSCGMCGRAVVLRGNASVAHCLKCREVRKLRAFNQQHQQQHHHHSSQQPQKPLWKRQRHVQLRPRRLVKSMWKSNEKLLVTKAIAETAKPTDAETQSTRSQSQPAEKRQLLKRPLVDGKVVSMLRRLGTSLTRENDADSQLPIIMQVEPVQQQQQQQQQWQAPRWLRPLDDDEILLDFNTAISEVLPRVSATAKAHRNDENAEPCRASRIDCNRQHNQSYQMSSVAAALPEDICSMLPKGLSVALVTH